MSFREFKDTCDYILKSIPNDSLAVNAVGFYAILIGIPKAKRKISRTELMDKCRITKNTLYKYVDALRSIGVLQTDTVQGEATRYIPLKVGPGTPAQKLVHPPAQSLGRPKKKDTHSSLESLGNESLPTLPDYSDVCDSSTLSRDSRGGGQVKDWDGSLEPDDQTKATKLIPRINKILPDDHKYRGIVPKRYAKKLLSLDAEGKLDEYTKWWVQEKLLNRGSSIYSFGWKIFMYPSMFQEFEKNHRTDEELGLKTTSKWAGREKAALAAMDEKLEKIKQAKARQKKGRKRGAR